MNWTTENPTAPGFYWIRRQESLAVVQVDTVGRVQFFGVKHVRPEEIPPGVEWYGPLMPPEHVKIEEVTIFPTHYYPDALAPTDLE